MTTLQEQIAARLVPVWAERDKRDPCSRSIRLVSLNACLCRSATHPCNRTGYLYVTPEGEILSGHTKAEAQPVTPQLHKQMMGQM